MDLATLQAEPRPNTGKGVARKLRAVGRAPAVCYGIAKEPAHLSVDPRAILQLLKSSRGRNSVVNLTIEGEPKPRMALLKDLQIHPLKRRILHVDFLEVSDDSVLKLNIPVKIVGQSEGVKAGGSMRWVLKEVAVFCKPADIPTEIEVDITPLKIGDVLYVENVAFGEGITSATKPRVPIVAVRSGRAEMEEDEEEEAEEGAAEPTAEAEAKPE